MGALASGVGKGLRPVQGHEWAVWAAEAGAAMDSGDKHQHFGGCISSKVKDAGYCGLGLTSETEALTS